MKYDLEQLPPRVRAQILRSRIPYRFREDNLRALETYDGEKKTRIDNWLAEMTGGKIVVASGEGETCGKGLLIEGPTGSGKTRLACVIANTVLRTMPDVMWRERWNRGVHVTPLNLRNPVMYFTYPEILATIKRGWDRYDDDDRGMMDSVFGHGPESDKVRLLVIDDLGKEHKGATGWSEHTLDHLLRERFDAGLPTIITTNVPQAQWAAEYGETLSSFSYDAFYSLPVTYGQGGDRRRRGKTA